MSGKMRLYKGISESPLGERTISDGPTLTTWCGWRIVISQSAGHVTLLHSIAGLARLLALLVAYFKGIRALSPSERNCVCTYRKFRLALRSFTKNFVTMLHALSSLLILKLFTCGTISVNQSWRLVIHFVGVQRFGEVQGLSESLFAPVFLLFRWPGLDGRPHEKSRSR
jgi:hypothetical protein